MTSTVQYEVVEPGIGVITLNRPDKRNAQDVRMTYELNDAFERAARDDAVKVIVLAAAGPHFSAGHDLNDVVWHDEFTQVSNWGGYGEPGAEGWVAREEEIYLEMCARWRSIPKPTIAAVQGRAIGGGLMLAWVCDLIIAADDAVFCDPVVAMGVCGVEWFVHPWELGPRKAKELLFTSGSWDADEAHRLGMVNSVVPRDELTDATLALARRIAAQPMFALRLTKEAVNQATDIQGQPSAVRAAFSLHQLAHTHNLERYGICLDPAGIPPALQDRFPQAEPDDKLRAERRADRVAAVADHPHPGKAQA
ncbi:enoyl-CoA hydratase [Pseudonocardia sp. C8]|uniref:enoyl-CoA hydratase n=1 Tax=Pseudonocardia sp. C8 TaxID=2762759 RepID=UPI001642EC40|nr:enoyl-CoA hydratase [Pseudonocardia sp. C8]MBC3192166.1 enoyl-CoA hydratase [Pseudonocardia sp. C8]